MAGLPEITLAGTLTADPELRYTPTGAAVANFTVATNDRRYDPTTQEWVDKGATFLRCSIWRQPAENVAESLTRGTRVLLTGTLRQREWQTNEGEKRYAFEVDVTEIGPSLKWATARPTKATRDHPTTPPPLAPLAPQTVVTAGRAPPTAGATTHPPSNHNPPTWPGRATPGAARPHRPLDPTGAPLWAPPRTYARGRCTAPPAAGTCFPSPPPPRSPP